MVSIDIISIIVLSCIMYYLSNDDEVLNLICILHNIPHNKHYS